MLAWLRGAIVLDVCVVRTGDQAAWLPPVAGPGAGDASEGHLPDRRELVVSTFRRLFPHSFVGVAAVRAHKARPVPGSAGPGCRRALGHRLMAAMLWQVLAGSALGGHGYGRRVACR